MRVNMAGVARAGLQQVDPKAVQPQAAGAQLHVQGLGVGLRMAVELAFQLREHGRALRQVVEGGVRGVAAIGVGLAPGAARGVLLGEHQDGLFELGVESLESALLGEARLIDLSDEQGAQAHDGAAYRICPPEGMARLKVVVFPRLMGDLEELV